MRSSIYYLPGHGGSLTNGLGQALTNRGFEVTGRETIGEFRRLRFSEQLEIVADDLQSAFWKPEARVIANSFGAYLFLNAQRLLPPYVGRVLLLSPIIGDFSNETIRMGFVPPHAGKLMELAETGKYTPPTQCEIHVGAQDWQSDPETVKRWAGMLQIPTTVVPNSGHALDKAYVSSLLDRWLA